MRRAVRVPEDFRYSPPGSPDEEPGFRRVRVAGDLKRDLRRLNIGEDQQHPESPRRTTLFQQKNGSKTFQFAKPNSRRTHDFGCFHRAVETVRRGAAVASSGPRLRHRHRARLRGLLPHHNLPQQHSAGWILHSSTSKFSSAHTPTEITDHQDSV